MKDFGLMGLSVLIGAVGVYLGTAGVAYDGLDIMAYLAAALVFCAQIVVVSTRKGVFLTALLAAGCNVYLFSLKFSTGKAICDGIITDCSGLNASAASEMFGLPITLYGIGLYVGLALASLRPTQSAPRFDQINGLFAMVSLVFSAYLGWEAKKLGLLCPMCITIYGCNALLLWGAFKGLKENKTSLFEGIDKIFGAGSLWIINSVFAIIVLVGASSWADHVSSKPVNIAKKLVEQHSEGQAINTDLLTTLYKRPRGTLELDGTEPLLGRASARFTIVEFADYGCPHCAAASPVLKQLVHDNPDIKLYFKAFPLSGACNPGIENPAGVERCKAAMAAECAGDQNKYYEMSSTMFRSLSYRSDDDLLVMANGIELDTDLWTQCMQSQAAVTAVLDDAKAGGRVGVAGTPAMFVKGLFGDDWIEITQGPEAILALVEAKRDGIDLPPPK